MKNAPNTKNGTWTQRVEGSTLVRVSGDSPCGVDPKDGMLSLRYHVEIRARKLDPSGFVLDNKAVMTQLEEISEVTISCELLSMTLAQRFYSQLEDQQQGSCTCVRVTIWGGTGASLEYSWPAED